MVGRAKRRGRYRGLREGGERKTNIEGRHRERKRISVGREEGNRGIGKRRGGVGREIKETATKEPPLTRS